jgi:hypothetical protein
VKPLVTFVAYGNELKCELIADVLVGEVMHLRCLSSQAPAADVAVTFENDFAYTLPFL